jgi:hypothetical protein
MTVLIVVLVVWYSVGTEPFNTLILDRLPAHACEKPAIPPK